MLVRWLQEEVSTGIRLWSKFPLINAWGGHHSGEIKRGHREICCLFWGRENLSCPCTGKRWVLRYMNLCWLHLHPFQTNIYQWPLGWNTYGLSCISSLKMTGWITEPQETWVSMLAISTVCLSLEVSKYYLSLALLLCWAIATALPTPQLSGLKVQTMWHAHLNILMGMGTGLCSRSSYAALTMEERGSAQTRQLAPDCPSPI